jgi:ECF transporter S component (folate family)
LYIAKVIYGRINKMAFFTNFKKSAAELKNIRCIVTIGLLLAAAVVLDGFGSIRIGDFLKINFTFLPLSMVGILFGPVPGLFAGLLTDIIGYLVNPVGGFIPALVLVSGLEGLIYGMVLYNLKSERTVATIIRIVVARLLVCGICNLTLNTLALYSAGFISGDSYGALVAARAATNIITFCLGSYMMMAVLLPVKQLYDRKIRRTGQKERQN